MFGLKLFLRAGRAVLDHDTKDAWAFHDSLSLIMSCFNAVLAMTTYGRNREAMDKLKVLFNKGFDAFLMLHYTAYLFEDIASNVEGSSPLLRSEERR